MTSRFARILVISSDDNHWLWLSEALGEHFTLVRETGNFESIAHRVGLISPTLAIVDFSIQLGVEPTNVVSELFALAPDLSIIAMGSKQSSDDLVIALRSGVKDFIDFNASAGEVFKIVDTVASAVPESIDSTGHAVVVLGGRPGVGATTLAVNIASQLRQKSSEETLLLDFGLPLGDGAIHMPCEDKHGAMDFVECVRSLKRFDATLARSAFKKNTQTDVSILPLPRNLADLRDVSAQDALKFLVLIKSFFNQIVIDLCGFNNIDFVANLLRIADDIVIVTNQSVPSVVTAAEQVKSLSDRGISTDKMLLVINEYDSSVSLSPETIASKMGIKRVKTLPSRHIELINAVNGGDVISSSNPKDAYSKAVKQLVDGMKVQPKTNSNRAASGIGKWWSKS